MLTSILILSLIALALCDTPAPATGGLTCSPAEEQAEKDCDAKFATCKSDAGADAVKNCNCFGEQIDCIGAINCGANPVEKAGLITQCRTTAGCSSTQCRTSGATSLVAPLATSAPATGGLTCSPAEEQAEKDCDTKFATCKANAGSDNVKNCNCFGDQIDCIGAINCGANPVEKAGLITQCRTTAGCSSTQCRTSGAASLVAPLAGLIAMLAARLF